LNLLSAVVMFLLMVLASGAVVDAVERYAFRLPVKKQRMAAMLIGFSLALPELFIGVASALEGKTQIALGNIAGANIANLSLVVGGLAVVSSVVPIVGEYLQKDLWITIGLAMLPFLMLTDGVLSGVEGAVLVAIYFVYAIFIPSKKSSYKEVRKKIEKHEKWALLIVAILGLIIMSASAWLLVQIVEKVASAWKTNLFWVGITLMAFGTTMPELLLLSAQKKRKAALMLPNLLNSVVINSTLVIGLVALMQPIVFGESLQRGLAGMFLIFILGLFWLFTKSKKKLERWEGLVLIGVYLMFVGLEMIFV